MTCVGVHLRVSPAKVRPGGTGRQVTPGEEAVEQDHDDDQEHQADTDTDQEGSAGVTRVFLRDGAVRVIPPGSEARGILRWTDGQPPELLLSDEAPWLGRTLNKECLTSYMFVELLHWIGIDVHFQISLSHP